MRFGYLYVACVKIVLRIGLEHRNLLRKYFKILVDTLLTF